MTKDPICENQVDERGAQSSGLTTQHDGRTFYFCSDECKQTFERFPDTYSRLDSPPGALDLGGDDSEGGFPNPGE